MGGQEDWGVIMEICDTINKDLAKFVLSALHFNGVTRIDKSV